MAEFYTHNHKIDLTSPTINGTYAVSLERVSVNDVKQLTPHFEINELNDIGGIVSYGPHVGDIVNVYIGEGIVDRYIIS